jgi:prepilin-type N-terminal cleavage/methylation domain-containing protein
MKITGPKSKRPSAFTLAEVMVTAAIMVILIVAAFAGIAAMQRSASRLADYTAAVAVVEAKVQDIRAATYNPPNYPFGSSVLYLTNDKAIALDHAGATFKVTGKVISKIEPVSGGHLVTVTGSFAEPKKPLSLSMQTIVNKYSGGRQ